MPMASTQDDYKPSVMKSGGFKERFKYDGMTCTQALDFRGGRRGNCQGTIKCTISSAFKDLGTGMEESCLKT